MQKSFLTLDNEFLKYCEINNVIDPEKLAKEVFQKGFTIVKYGEIPNGLKGQNTVIEKEVIKEVIVEKFIDRIVEKPIEVIKEVIKEVPVEVIKEVMVEVTNSDEIDRLTEENKKLKEELEKITSSLEALGRKGKLMKDSNLSSLYDE